MNTAGNHRRGKSAVHNLCDRLSGFARLSLLCFICSGFWVLASLRIENTRRLAFLWPAPFIHDARQPAGSEKAEKKPGDRDCAAERRECHKVPCVEAAGLRYNKHQQCHNRTRGGSKTRIAALYFPKFPARHGKRINITSR